MKYRYRQAKRCSFQRAVYVRNSAKSQSYDPVDRSAYQIFLLTESEVLHSRTGFSKRSMNGARSFSAGYQMYLHGYLRWVTTVDTQWAGDNDRLVNNRKGYVRCVRDLE